MSSPVKENSTAPAFTALQQQVVLALAQGRSISAAAAAAGLHRATIHKWLSTDPEFAQAVNQARADYALALQDQMHDLSAMALNTLRSLMENPETPFTVRMRTSIAVLDRPPSGWILPDRAAPPKTLNQVRQELQAAKLDSKEILDPETGDIPDDEI